MPGTSRRSQVLRDRKAKVKKGQEARYKLEGPSPALHEGQGEGGGGQAQGGRTKGSSPEVLKGQVEARGIQSSGAGADGMRKNKLKYREICYGETARKSKTQ